MSKLSKVATLALATFFAAAAAASPAYAIENSFLCKSSGYDCTNKEFSGVTGYAGYDGPYGYDINEFGDHIAHNCTSYVAYRFYDIMGYYNPSYNKFGNAADWEVNVKKYVPGASIGSVPYVGDIAQWDFGHVAWVEYVHYNTAGTPDWIVISDDNYGLKITSQRKLYRNQTLGVISWPNRFIGLPIYYGGGGGKPPVAMIQPLPTF